LKRFGFVNGQPVFVNEEGNLEEATGGTADVMGAIAAELPEIIGAVGGAFTPNPVFGSALGVTIGESIKQILSGVFLDDPKTISGVALEIGTEAALDLTFGGIAKAGIGLANKRAIAAGEKGINPAALQEARETIFKSTGIELDIAQVSGIPELKQLKKWASKFPGDAAEIIQASDDIIAGQSQAAIERIIGIMSRGNPTLKLGIQGVNAAKAAITAAKVERAAAVAPLYRKAWQDTVQVNTDDTLALIDDLLIDAKGPIKSTLKQVRGLFNKADTSAIKVSKISPADESIKRLQNTATEQAQEVARLDSFLDDFERGIPGIGKRIQTGQRPSIDELRRALEGRAFVKDLPTIKIDGQTMVLRNPNDAVKLYKLALSKRNIADKQFGKISGQLSEAQGRAARLRLDDTVRGLHNTKRSIRAMIETKRAGTKILDAETLKHLRDIDASLTNNLVEQSADYARATAAFNAKTKQLLDPLLNSPVGVLSLLEKNPGQAAAKIFSGDVVDPTNIRLARNAILKIEAKNPELSGAWDGLVAQWLQKNLTRAAKELQTGEAVNVAGKFRQAVIGTNVQKAAMREAIGPQAVKQFDQIMEALKKVASTPLGGSDTAFNQLVTRKLDQNTFTILQSVLSPRKVLLEAQQQRFLNDLSVAIANGLTNPSKVAELNRLFALKPSTEKAVLITALMLGQTTAAASFGVDQQPALLQQTGQQQSRSVLDELETL